MEKIGRRRRRFHAIFGLIWTLILLIFLYARAGVVNNPLPSQRSNLDSIHKYSPNPRRRFPELRTADPSNKTSSNDRDLQEGDPVGKSSAICAGIAQHEGYSTNCEFLKAHQQCTSGGFFDYVTFFYCDCEKVRVLGFSVLGLWLMALFYLLGNTAADYFCCNLAKLSDLLNLHPTVAGVTLLPLGNGAPDVFAGIAAFLGTGAGDFGLNSILGGAVFVTCVVAGTVSLFAAGKDVQLDRKCFMRDIGFFLLTLVSLSLILIAGKIGFWGAVSFVSIYIVYAFVVAAGELLRKHARMLKLDMVTPLLPIGGAIFSQGNEDGEPVHNIFLDDYLESDVPQLHPALPQWMWASHVDIYSNRGSSFETNPLWGWNEEEEAGNSFMCSNVISWMEMPLIFPRRLTIPIVEEERWSKVYAVSSASLAPILLAFIWNISYGEGHRHSIAAYVVGGILGVAFGILAFLFTVSDHPPRTCLFPWVSGGFVMSITWFYLIANELVEILVALGVIVGVRPSILALTVLAWGNSTGDLMSNVALMLNGGDGVQIAMSGCYAGPMFNTLAGLGISMLLGALSVTPASYVLPWDHSLVYTISFLMFALIWPLFVLPLNDMRPNRTLGLGLITFYLIFLLVSASSAMGILPSIVSH